MYPKYPKRRSAEAQAQPQVNSLLVGFGRGDAFDFFSLWCRGPKKTPVSTNDALSEASENERLGRTNRVRL